MRINHNISAFNTWRSNLNNLSTSSSVLEKLSSGLRINQASDDAAGLSISEKMRGQIRGLGQASRNIQDGISLLQTAEGSLNEVHSLLQRGRELAVQAANDTYTLQDKSHLQSEMNQIVKEIDRISKTSEFNTISLLNAPVSLPGSSELLQSLKTTWLFQSVSRISTYFGINGANVPLDINIIQGAPGGVLAFVSSMVNGLAGVGTNLSLNIEMADVSGSTIGGLSADRVITHEMTHAVMASVMNWSETVNGSETSGIPTWFREGTAEFIHGADERLAGDLGTTTPGLATAQGIVDLLGPVGTAWVSDSAHYSAAYAAVSYMHDKIIAAGGTGIKDVLQYLAADPTRSLDDAITNATNGAFTDVSDFKTDFAAVGLGGGADYIANQMDLTDTDTGAVGGADDGGGVLTDTTVIPDAAGPADPTTFQEIYPSFSAAAPLSMQVGANAGEALSLALTTIDSTSLGIANIDLINNAGNSIDIIDSAIAAVSTERSRFGAIQNRLEHAMSVTDNYNENLSASESRIRDADMAKEMTEFTKAGILNQSSIAMLSHSNQNPQSVLQLLRT